MCPAHEESAKILKELRPAVFAFWYHQIYFLLYYFGSRRMAILMTPQGKTDNMTSVAPWMGLHVARGSLEGGGRHALLTLLEYLKMGRPVAIAASGSLGPVTKCKPGAFILAQEAEVPIIPIAWHSKLAFRIPRRQGESMLIPLPFNRIEVRLGEPFRVQRYEKINELNDAKDTLASQLNQLSL